MRITKLQILIFLAMLGATSFSLYRLKIERAEMAERETQLKNKLAALQSELAVSKKREEDAAKKWAELAPPIKSEESTPTTSAAEPPTEPEPSPMQEVTYTVQKGDTLWSIAKMKEHFGAGHRWYDIWKANEETIFDFDKIVRGQTLTIPLDKPEGTEWPQTSRNKREKLLEIEMSSTN